MRRLKPQTLIVIFAFCFLLLLLCLPDIVFYSVTKQPYHLLEGILTVGSIFILPIIIFRKRLKTYALLLGIIGFTSLLAAIPVFYFGLILNKQVMLLIYNTHYQEAYQLLGGYMWQLIAATVLYWLIVIFIIRLVPARIPLSLAWRVSTVSLLLLLGISIAKFGLKRIPSNLKHIAVAYYPFYIGYYGKQFYDEIKIAKEHPGLVKDFRFDAKQQRSHNKRQIYVLFIGESSRFDHWGINGYLRKTSPILSKRTDLISYNKVCAAGGLTELSVPMILTQAEPRTYGRHNYEKSIISLFHNAGFHTYWISDQVDGINVMMHTREADSLILLQSGYNAVSHIHYDMELIDKLKEVVISDSSNLFIVIHSLGSHFAYNYRYPNRYDRFQPSGDKQILQPNNKALKQEYINGYDNSILYDDAVLDSAIQIIDKINTLSFLYFISDHGENLYDDDRNLFQHSPSHTSVYIAHVPLFIFTSKDYNKTFPGKVKNLKRHINDPINGFCTFNTLADMAGIRFTTQDLALSIGNSHFKDTARIILGGDEKVYRYNQLY